MQSKNSEAQSRIKSLQAEVDVFKNKAEVLEGSLRLKSNRVEELEKEMENLNGVNEEKLLYMQMQMNVTKNRDESREKELMQIKKKYEDLKAHANQIESTCGQYEIREVENIKQIEALTKRINEMEPELKKTKKTVAEYERHAGVAVMLKAEQEGLLSGIKRDLKAALDAKEQLSSKLAESEAARSKLQSVATQLSAVSEQVGELQTSLEEKSAIIRRMTAEAQASAAQHAVRTAMLATCEEQLDAARREIATFEKTLQQKDTAIIELNERVSQLQKESANSAAEFADRIRILEAKAELATAHHSAELDGLRQEHAAEIDALKKDFSKKSTTARVILNEKEEAVRTLTQRVKELEEEIISGAPSERKIFELAQAQAKREATHGLHKDNRELVLQQLQEVLAAKDHELARLQQSHQILSEEVADLRRTNRREGVNMDYLKNVVLQVAFIFLLKYGN